MFDLKNNSNEELLSVVDEIEFALNHVPANPGDDCDMVVRNVLAPFMAAATEEIIRLRLELSNTNEIKAMQKKLLTKKYGQIGEDIK